MSSNDPEKDNEFHMEKQHQQPLERADRCWQHTLVNLLKAGPDKVSFSLIRDFNRTRDRPAGPHSSRICGEGRPRVPRGRGPPSSNRG